MKTQNEKLLERYFNEVFKPNQFYPAPHIVNAFGENDPKEMEYKDLSEKEREAIANSYGYQAWVFGVSKEDFVQACHRFAEIMQATMIKVIPGSGRKV